MQHSLHSLKRAQPTNVSSGQTRLIALLLAALTLASCTTAPPQAPAPREQTEQYSYEPAPPSGESDTQPSLPDEVDVDVLPADVSEVELWLENARTASPDIAAELKLRAANALLRDGEPGQADEAVNDLVLPELSAEYAVQLAIIRARILRAYGEFRAALAVLEDPLLDNYIQTADIRQQIQFSQMRASLFAIEGDHLAAVREWIFIHPLLRASQKSQSRQQIWQGLMQIPGQVLLNSMNSADDRDYQGWLELAAVAKDNQGNIDAQIAQRDAWLQRWRSHPARADGKLPGGLSDLEAIAITRPNQVALLLPVTGGLAAYGKAIRDGFVAAQFESRARGAQVPSIRVYDSASGDIVELYQRIVRDGSDLVVGPLRKENLQALVTSYPDIMPLPTLALNRVDGLRFPAGFFQFGLNPEDEAAQVASITRAKGLERVMTLSPQGSWGAKVVEAFGEQWQALGGQLITGTTFDAESNNFSKQIKTVLQIDASEKRRSRLQQIIGLRPEFEPRRRGDIDFIFLVARPREARAIKPLLDYHYAGDLPVYATSHLYSGVEDPTRNQDINGIHFVDIPWLFERDSPIRRTILNDTPGGAAMQRMYALGIDSFRLHLRLDQLGKDDDASVFGETGTLRLNSRGQIERQLIMAEIRQGRAEMSATDDLSDAQDQAIPLSW